MLANIIKSKPAVNASIAFVRLREMLLSNAELSRKLTELERKYDERFAVVFDAIRELMSPPGADEDKPLIRFTLKTKIAEMVMEE